MSASQAPSCSRCGERLPEGAVFCPACGTRVSGSQETFSRYPPPFAFATEHARRRLAQAARGFGARARALAETAAIRSRAQSELNRLRYARLEALERRGALLAELGAAVYENDAEATDRIRGEIAKLDERVAATEAQMQQLAAEADERVRKASLPVQDTEIADDRTARSSD
jgi:hypothetical protein